MLKTFRKQKGLWFNCWGQGLLFVIMTIIIFILSFFNVSGAADHPIRPIQIIVTFPPVGGSDITAHTISNKIFALLGQPVVVVNKPGGGGSINIYAVLAAPPDGYTTLVISPSIVKAPLVRKAINFDFIKDFNPINLSVGSPIVIVVKKDAPWRTLEEFVAEAKKNPGKLTYSTPGYGATQHFAGELFKMYTGVDVTNVPMDGTAPGLLQF